MTTSTPSAKDRPRCRRPIRLTLRRRSGDAGFGGWLRSSWPRPSPAGWYSGARTPTRARRCARRQGRSLRARTAGRRGRGEERQHRCLSQCARHGDAAQRRHGEAARGRPVDARRLSRRTDRQGGRTAGGDRPAAIRRAADAGRRTNGQGPGASQERADRPRALSDAARAGFDLEAAGRHAGRAGAPIRGRGAVGPGRDRQRQAATHLRDA